MFFDYPPRPRVRKHGPVGYTDPASFKDWLRDEFAFRCVYCLVRERWYPNGHQGFGVEHAKPTSRFPDLSGVYENLVYACNRCNSHKRDLPLLDPGAAAFGEHLRIHPTGAIQGLTAEGRNVILVLRLDFPEVQRVRENYLKLFLAAQKHPDNPLIQSLFQTAFGFPDDLPNLAALRPLGNSRPEALRDCFHQQRLEGRLPETY